MKINFKGFPVIAKAAFKRWWEKDPFRESAIIAYYAIFSLPGLLVVIITLAGVFFGRDQVSDHLAAQISAAMGEDTAEDVTKMIAVAGETKASLWATIIGIATILYGATGVFAQFQKSLNIIWEVKADESKSGFWHLVKVRLFSFGLIVSIAFMLVTSLIVSAILNAFGDWLSGRFSESLLIVLQVINSLITLLILSSLFAIMFKYLPDARIKWRHVYIGAVVTALLFEIGKFGLGLYFGKADPATGYGAAGSVVLILTWVSYTSMIVFYGAEFTRAYAVRFEGKILPAETAVKQKGRKA